MREVAAVGQVQSENSVARLQDGRIGLHVGLRSRMGLHIGVLCAKKLLGAVAGQVLDYISKLAPAVIALAWVAFGIFIGED